MAVTLTVSELLAALRMGGSAEETAEATRLLAYATGAVVRHAPDAPDAAHNEAVIRVSGYLFDQPFATRDSAYSNALRNSGAASMLLPYRVHRAGSVSSAVSEAVASARASNPVISVTGVGQILTVLYADGTSIDITLDAAGDDAFDWATVGDPSTIPDSKIDAGIARVAALPDVTPFRTESQIERLVSDGVADWAETGNPTPIPVGKLTNAPTGGGGGGGGGGLGITLHGSAAFNVTIAGRWLITTILLPPSSATWMLVGVQLGDVLGAFYWVNVADFLALTPVAHGGTFNTSDPHVEIGEDYGDTHRVSMRPGTTGRIAIASTHAGIDPAPLTVYLVSGSGGGSGDATGDDAYEWATEGNEDAIPANKLTNAPAGGLDETQVDARIDQRIITIGPTGALGTPTAAQYNAGVLLSH